MIYRRSQSEMPATNEEVNAAIQEGIKITFLTTPLKIAKLEEKLALTCVHMQLGELDESGRRRSIPIDGSDFTIGLDTIIIAIGQMPDVPTAFSMKTNADSTIQVNAKTLATDRKGVWAGGDVPMVLLR